MAEDVKKRRLTQQDQSKSVEFVYDLLKTRAQNKFRKDHEEIWREVDRQVAMQPPAVSNRSGNLDEDWHNVIQLGLLADALEILSADVMRLAFPGDRIWFAPHVDIAPELDPETGEGKVPRKIQKSTDGVLRSLMAQQHADFGFKDRVKLSVKEALNHGGMVVEASWEQMAKFHDGSNVEALSAPVWQPRSMWNCFPDDAEYVIGTDLIYRGSMIIKTKMLHAHLQKMTKWINLEKIVKPKGTDEVEVVTYYGDLILSRSQGENMFLPNRKTIFVEKNLVFSEINETPYQPIIYTGYERDNVLDPYYTSPLIKRAPTAKMATRSAGKFLDGVDLKTEPPVIYEQHDTFFAANGGPEIAPGSRNPTTGAANVKLMDVGDPGSALSGLQYAISEVEKGTGSNSIRQGVTSGNELTATEIVKAEQRGELRTVDFVGVLERQALKPFLYMQHDMNLKKLDSYPVYNDEINTPDFLYLSKQDLGSRAARFEIVGSRDLLGEEQRVARFREMAGFVLSNELLASKTDIDQVLMQGWQDARVKSPERFLINSDPDMEEKIAALQEGFEAQLAELQQQLQQFQFIKEKNDIEKEALQMQIQRERTDANTYRESNRILMETRQAEDRLRGIQKQLEKQKESMPEGDEKNEINEIEGSIIQLADTLADIEEQRKKRVDDIMREIERVNPEVAGRLQ